MYGRAREDRTLAVLGEAVRMVERPAAGAKGLSTGGDRFDAVEEIAFAAGNPAATGAGNLAEMGRALS